MPPVDINRAWETVIYNIKISAKESLGYKLKKHKPWLGRRVFVVFKYLGYNIAFFDFIFFGNLIGVPPVV
jgi:hypothetical protein